MIRKLRLLALLAVLVIVLHDWGAPTRRDIGVKIAVFTIDQYRSYVSPRLGKYVQCRFKPSCSRYGREAMLKYGLGSGSWRTFKRIVRCNPITTKRGTVDPV